MIEENKARIKRWIQWKSCMPSELVHDEFKVIFVHIPKTGGTSIRNLLCQSRTMPPQRYAHLDYHAKAKVLRAAVGPKKWEQFTRIAVVRNPWDWTVSSYHWWIQLAGKQVKFIPTVKYIESLGSFEEYVRSDFYYTHIHNFEGRDFIEWISHKGKLMVDCILRFESLNDDWANFVKTYGKSLPADLPVENSSKRSRNYKDYYTQETIDIVASKFKETIDRFGYTYSAGQ